MKDYYPDLFKDVKKTPYYFGKFRYYGLGDQPSKKEYEQ